MIIIIFSFLTNVIYLIKKIYMTK